MGCPHERIEALSICDPEMSEDDDEALTYGPMNYWDMSLEERENHENDRWYSKCHDVVSDLPSCPPTERIDGQIILAGSGVQSVSDVTRKLQAVLNSSDEVYVHSVDPVTKLFIKHTRPDTMDLDVFRKEHNEQRVKATRWLRNDDTKQNRSHSADICTGSHRDNNIEKEEIVQMAEVILHDARQGQKVTGIFFGNPVYYAVVQRIIAIARLEKISIEVLPAPSIADHLMADLHLTLHGKDIHIIDMKTFPLNDTYSFTYNVILLSTFDNRDKVISHLKNNCNPDKVITIYTPGLYPNCQPIKQHISVKDVTKSHIRNANTTLFVPKCTMQQVAHGLKSENRAHVTDEQENKQWEEFYDNHTMTLLGNLDKWQVPKTYRHPLKSELSQTIMDLASDHVSQESGCENKILTSTTFKGVLLSADTDVTSFFLYHNVSVAAYKSIVALWRSEQLRSVYLEYITKLDPTKAANRLDTTMECFLKTEGLHSIPSDILSTWDDIHGSNLSFWTGEYHFHDKIHLTIEGSLLERCDGHVTFDSRQIVDFSFRDSLLSWRIKDGNSENAELYLRSDMLEGDTVYPVLHIQGFMWKDKKPDKENLVLLSSEGGACFGTENDTQPRLFAMNVLFEVQRTWQSAHTSYMSYLEAKSCHDIDDQTEQHDRYTNAKKRMDSLIASRTAETN